jgi:two-component system response regulator FixJ
MNEQTGGSIELFIVDDDSFMREALSIVFTEQGYKVTTFSEGDSFLAIARSRRPSCVLLDIQMPGSSGLDVLKELQARHYDVPVFIVSARGDIPKAVEAIKHGAFDFIEKPFALEDVVKKVGAGIDAWKRKSQNGAVPDSALRNFRGRGQLTPRECEVLGQIAGGASNKEAGRQLGISPRTIEVHRARIMEKIGAKNAADLVRIVLTETREVEQLVGS